MSALPADVTEFIASARLGRLATADGTGQPLVLPICYAWDGEALVSAIDAKPKRAGDLKRVRNIRENPKVSVVIDHYDEDWRRLWWVLLRGETRVLRDGVEHRRALAALRRKYPQYREGWPLDGGALVIALDVVRLRYWRSSSPGRRRAVRPDPPA